MLLAGGIAYFGLNTLSSNSIKQEALETNLSRAELAAGFTQKYMSALETNIRAFAERPDVRQAILNDTTYQLQTVLTYFAQSQLSLESAAIFDTDGVQLLNSIVDANTVGQSYADRAWFQEVMATRQPVLSAPVLSRLTGSPSVPYSVPILDDQGQVRGMLNGVITLKALSESIVNIDYGRDTRASVIYTGDGGIIIAHVDPTRLMTPVSGKNDAIRRLLSGEVGSIETPSSTGELDLIGFTQVPYLPWGVLVITPSASALAPIGDLMKNLGIAIGGLMLGAGILGILLVFSITRPLRRLVKVTSEIGLGNFDYQIDTYGHDEVGDLARSINAMTTDLQKTLVSRDELTLEVMEHKQTETKLKGVSIHQETVLSTVPDIITEVDNRKVYTWVNQAGIDFFGLDVLGQEASFYFEGAQDTYGYMQPLFNGSNNTVYAESWQRRKDGQKRLLAWWCRSMIDEKGNVTGALCVAQDITERRKIEDELKLEAQILDVATDSIFLHTLEGKFVYVNEEAYKSRGYTKEELLGMKLQQLDAPWAATQIVPRVRDLQEKGEVTFESAHICKDGHEMPVEVHARIIENGGQRLILSVSRDTTERQQAKKALEDSEKRYRDLYEQSPAGYQSLSADGRFLEVNQTWLSLLGYTKEEVIGHWFGDFLIPTEVEKFTVNFQRLKRTGGIHSELWVKRKDDQIRLLACDGRVAYDLQGNFRQTHCIIQDITENRRATEAIAKAAHEWSTTFDSISDMVSIQDRNYKVLRVNKAYASALGMATEDIIGKTCFEIVHGTKESIPGCPHRVTLETGKPASFESYDEHKGTYSEISTYPIFDEQGLVTATVHIVHDITNRKRFENELHLRGKLLDSAIDSIFMYTPEGKLVYANEEAYKSRGYTIEELLKMNIRQLRTDEQQELVESQTRSVINQELSIYETVHSTKDGRHIPVEVHSQVFKYDGHDYILSITRDISERKQSEAESMKLRDKAEMSSRLAAVGEMAAGIAHEINNPLTGVIGFSEMLMERQELPADIKEDLKIINDGSQQVKGIIKRMLTFAQQSKPNKAIANIHDLIDNTLELRTYVLRTANIEVVREYSPEVPLITVDPGQLQQVFLNFIVNAEYAMKKAHGKGKLTIKTERTGDQIHITFQDDGGGIPNEIKAKLFQPFFTTKAPGEGTGLGLSLSRGIILEHGGTLEEVGEPGIGATFVIHLPIGSEETGVIPENRIDTSNKTLTTVKNAHILIVDDEPSVRALAKAILIKNGHFVTESGNPEEALDKIKQNEYDIVLLDIRMPGKSGIEFFDEIHSQWPDLAKRVVFVTGDVSDLNTQEYLKGHNVPWITKPFERAALEAKVNEIIQSGNAT